MWWGLLRTLADLRLLALRPDGARRWAKSLADPRFVVGVNAVVADDLGRVLLVHQGLQPVDCLRLPGRRLGRRESFEQCAVRAVLEETGRDASIGPVVWVSRPQDAGGRRGLQIVVSYTASLGGEGLGSSVSSGRMSFVPITHLPAGLPPNERNAIVAAAAMRRVLSRALEHQ
jgi:ADP-ribose pyrophosphatase YjhB (NUDIX family)